MESEARIVELLEEISAKLDKLAETIEDAAGSIQGAIELADSSRADDDLGPEFE